MNNSLNKQDLHQTLENAVQVDTHTHTHTYHVSKRSLLLVDSGNGESDASLISGWTDGLSSNIDLFTVSIFMLLSQTHKRSHTYNQIGRAHV